MTRNETTTTAASATAIENGAKIETMRWSHEEKKLVPSNPDRDLNALVSVEMKEVSGGFAFWGAFGDGVEPLYRTVIRKKATTAYKFAAIHMMPTVSKFVSTDFRAYVSFHGSKDGARNAARYSDRILKVIEVTPLTAF